MADHRDLARELIALAQDDHAAAAAPHLTPAEYCAAALATRARIAA